MKFKSKENEIDLKSMWNIYTYVYIHLKMSGIKSLNCLVSTFYKWKAP